MIASLKTMRRSDWVVLVLLSLMISFFGVCGVSYIVGEGWPVLSLGTTILLIGLFTVLVALIFLIVDAALARSAEKHAAAEVATAGEGTHGGTTVEVTVAGEGESAEATAAETPSAPRSTRSRFALITPQWCVKSILLFAFIMTLFWLPWYIANFPGGTYWDTYYQMFQVYPENHPISIVPWEEMRAKTVTDAWLVDHHPVLTTLLYGGFAWASDQLTGNWMAGVALFCALQGIAHVIIFTASIAYLRRVGCPLVLCCIGYAFYCLMPFVSTWAMCMVKDSFFGMFFVIYFLMLFEGIRTRGVFLARPRTIVAFLALALMLCLSRKTGIFVVVPTALVMAFVFRKNLRAAGGMIAQAALGLVVMGVLLPQVVFPALNIHEGGRQEVLGPLLQQTARVAVDHGDEITPRERAEINKVIDYGRLADVYTFDFEDAVKYRYNQDATSADIADYLGMYVKQGLEHPESYFAAFMSLAGFYVAPTAFANIRMVTVDTKMGEENRYMLWNPDELDPLRLGLDEAYTTLASIPVLDLPFLIVTYVLWLPALLFYIAKRRRLSCGALFVPSFVLLCFCMISPVYDARYAVPLFDIAPLLFCSVVTLLYNATQRKRREYDT